MVKIIILFGFLLFYYSSFGESPKKAEITSKSKVKLPQIKQIPPINLTYPPVAPIVPIAPVNLPCDDNDCPELEVVYCPEEILKDEIWGTVVFEKTVATVNGERVIIPCPFGFRDDGALPLISQIPDKDKHLQMTLSGLHRKCELQARVNDGTMIGQWVPADISDIQPIDCRYQQGVILSESMQRAVSSINILNMKQVFPIFSALLLNMLEYTADDYECAKNFVESISSIFEFIESVEPFLGREGILMELFDKLDSYSRGVALLPGYRTRLATSTIQLETALFPENYDDTEIVESYFPNFSDVDIKLPMQTVEMAIMQGVTPRVQLTAYNKKMFFAWEIGHNASDGEDEGFLGSYRVVSANFMGAQISNLREPIVYTMHVNHSYAKENDTMWTCVFWDNETKSWSQDGIRTVEGQDSIQCESSHLTAFSAILNPIPVRTELDTVFIMTPEHTTILEILSSIGSALSIAGLAITCLTYGLFRCLRKDRSNRILFHLSLSLMLLHLMSVTSEKFLWGSQCLVPASLLHYFLLTSLCWMLLEALHMFQLLICVFVKPESKFLLKRAAFAWGLPLLIVIICASVHPEVYKEGRGDLCLIAASLNLPLYYSAYLGPAVLILAINSFIFCRLIRVLYKQGARTRKQSMMITTLNKTGNMDWKSIKNTRKLKVSPTEIKGAITVMILVGVGWVFALFAIGPFQLFFSYLFVICNAGQGIFIFIFRVAIHPVASRTWKRVLLGISPDADVSTSSTGSGQQRQSVQSFSASPTFISNSSSVQNSLTPSDPLSAKLASNLATILRSGDMSSLKDNDITPPAGNVTLYDSLYDKMYSVELRNNT